MLFIQGLEHTGICRPLVNYSPGPTESQSVAKETLFPCHCLFWGTVVFSDMYFMTEVSEAKHVWNTLHEIKLNYFLYCTTFWTIYKENSTATLQEGNRGCCFPQTFLTKAVCVHVCVKAPAAIWVLEGFQTHLY